MTGTYVEFGQLQAANFQAQSAKDIAHESARATGNVRTRVGCADGGDLGVLDGRGIRGELPQFGGDFGIECGKDVVENSGNGLLNTRKTA